MMENTGAILDILGNLHIIYIYIYIMDGLLPRIMKHCKRPNIGCYHTILLESDFFVGFPLQRHWSSWQCGRRKGGPFSFQVY